MHPAKDYGIRELGKMELKLREDLVFTFQEFSGRPCYLIEDPLKSSFYRIGIAEYTFISLLDGKTPISDALSRTAEVLGRDAFTETNAAAICRWLIDSQLAYTDESSQTKRLFAAARTGVKRRVQTALNPMYIKIPLLNPDRLLEAALPWCGWVVGRPAFFVWLVVVLAGLYHVGSQASRFAASSAGILAAENWIALGLAWVLLKIVHEFFHGLVCKRGGGSAPETGIVLILFVPIAYVDVTSAWRLDSKWQRIHVSAAGMYAELFCASLAALVWSATGPGLANHLAYSVVIMAGVSTLLFNGNPLMRFDGYYILADLLEVPNLYSRGQEFLRYLGRRYLLGVKARPPESPRRKGAVVKVYGVLAFWWRIVVLVSLLVAAQALFLGAGLVIAVVAVVLWFGVPMVRFAEYLWGGNAVEKPSLPRFLASVTAGAGIACLLFWGLAWPSMVRAPGIVEYAPMAIVRADSPGFAREILVGNNQRVEAGEVLGRLANEELETELADLELAIRESDLRSRHYQQEDRLAESKIEARYRKALQQRRAEVQRQLQRLTVRAPISGRVIGRNLAMLPDTYLKPGTEILSIAGDAAKEVKISIDQEDVDVFADRVGTTVDVCLRSSLSDRFPGELVRVNPLASRAVPHEALIAPAGGSLAVQPVANLHSDWRDTEKAYELVAPRFNATVELVGDLSTGLKSGQRATVRFRSYHERIGPHLYRLLCGWIRGISEHARQR